MKLFSWFVNLVASEPVKEVYNLIDPKAAGDGVESLTIALTPGSQEDPSSVISVYWTESQVKVFERKFSSGQESQSTFDTMKKDLATTAELIKNGKMDEAKKMLSSVFENYSTQSDPLLEGNPEPLTHTMASANDEPEPDYDEGDKYCPECKTPNQFGELCNRCALAAAEQLAEGYDMAEGWSDYNHEAVLFNKEEKRLTSKLSKCNTLFKSANGEQKQKISNIMSSIQKSLQQIKQAKVVMQNIFFSTPEEALTYQKKMIELQPKDESLDGLGDEPGEGLPGENNDLIGPPSQSYDQVEKEKAQETKDLSKRIEQEVKDQVESALDQKVATLFTEKDETLVKALRGVGRTWDEIKDYLVKGLKYDKDGVNAFIDKLRETDESPIEEHDEIKVDVPEGPAEAPKPPAETISPETHDKLVQEEVAKMTALESSQDKISVKNIEDSDVRAVAEWIKQLPMDKFLQIVRPRFYEQEFMQMAQDLKQGKDPILALKPRADQKDSVTKQADPLPPLITNEGPLESTPQSVAPSPEPAPIMHQDTEPEPEILNTGDFVYVLGDYEKNEPGFKGMFVEKQEKEGLDYAIIDVDGTKKEVPMHLVTKASLNKQAKHQFFVSLRTIKEHLQGEPKKGDIFPYRGHEVKLVQKDQYPIGRPGWWVVAEGSDYFPWKESKQNSSLTKQATYCTCGHTKFEHGPEGCSWEEDFDTCDCKKFKQEKQSSLDVKADPETPVEQPKVEKPVEYKPYKITPPHTDVKEVVPPSSELLSAYKKAEKLASELSVLEAKKDKIMAQALERVRELESTEGRVKKEVQLKQIRNTMAHLMSESKASLVDMGMTALKLVDEMKTRNVKLTDKEIIQHVVEKIAGAGKFVEELKAQTNQLQENVYQLVEFPLSRQTSLDKSAGAWDTLKDMFTTLKNMTSWLKTEKDPKDLPVLSE